MAGSATIRLIGGAGNDTFVINSAGDLLFDSGGVDLVRSTVSKTLAAGFENLTLLGTAPINGAGNAAANTILGNAGSNRLFGLGGNDTLNGGAGHDTLDGGLGNDRMIGGAGNDTFVVNAAGDVLSDSAGIDLVKSTVSRTLAAGFEKLTLLGAAAINGTGNAAANVITGNGGNNKLSGLGGNDTINGGLGKDILTGGFGRDILFGGSGIDILTGGLGKDTMTGGAGADDFDFNSVAEIGKGATRDVIRDFAHLVDDIDLSTIDANGAAPGTCVHVSRHEGRGLHRDGRRAALVPAKPGRRRQRPDHHRRRHQRQPRRRLPDSAHWHQISDPRRLHSLNTITVASIRCGDPLSFRRLIAECLYEPRLKSVISAMGPRRRPKSGYRSFDKINNNPSHAARNHSAGRTEDPQSRGDRRDIVFGPAIGGFHSDSNVGSRRS